jgi:hypothetical protein
MLQIVNPKTIKVLHRSELTAPAISPTPAEEPANPVTTEPTALKQTAGRTAELFRISPADLRKAVAHIRATTEPVSEVERAYARSSAAERDAFIESHAIEFLNRIDRLTAPATT